MRILQLINRIPYPLNDGGSIGIHYYIEGFLQAGVSLSVLAMNTSRHYVSPNQLPEIYKKLENFVVIDIDNRIRPIGAVKSLIRNSSYNIDRFIDKYFEQALIELLTANQFDIIQLEGLYLAPYLAVIKQYSDAKISIRQHNVEFLIWERLASQSKNLIKKWYLKVLAKQLKKFELDHLKYYDIILPISNNDASILKAMNSSLNLYLHPFGINTSKFKNISRTPQKPIQIYHIGAMDWLPNQESVDWLLEHVMPLLKKSHPEIMLYLAGRNMPQKYFSLQYPNVSVIGEVEDAQAFEKDKDVLLVPLLSGGGVRIKIFQAMASGKAIITTSIGVEGIDAVNNEHLMLANTPEQFANAIIQLNETPLLIHKLGNNAQKLIQNKYDQTELIQKLLKVYNALIHQDL